MLGPDIILLILYSATDQWSLLKQRMGAVQNPIQIATEFFT